MRPRALFSLLKLERALTLLPVKDGLPLLGVNCLLSILLELGLLFQLFVDLGEATGDT